MHRHDPETELSITCLLRAAPLDECRIQAEDGGVRGGVMADSPYQKAPGASTALIVIVVLGILALVAFLAANGELYRWM